MSTTRFFDNVNYSQLADFFFVWQRHILGERGSFTSHTTRSDAEVQQRDPHAFAERLGGVWRECHRVLKPDGLLVFTYHHSRSEGWRCVLASLVEAGFMVSRAHPIKSEMSVATPKHQANEPIDLDMIMVCGKASPIDVVGETPEDVVRQATAEARLQLNRLRKTQRRVSRNDIRVVVMAQALARLSRYPSAELALAQFDAVEVSAEKAIEQLYRRVSQRRTE